MIISDLPKVMIISLIITITIELVFSIIFGYRKKDLITIILVNILTNPLLNSLLVYIDYYYGLKVRNISLFIMEVGIVLIEGIIYYKYLEKRKINGFILSFILNILSFSIGMLINNFIY